MSEYVLFALLGLGSGAVVALLSCGLVVGYRGSGVVNFALGSIAMYTAYTDLALRTLGKYPLPIPGLPGYVTITKSGSVSTFPALVLSVATAALLGLLMYLAVFRSLRNAPMLAKVIATIGVMLALQSAIAYRFGTSPTAPPRLLPHGTLFRYAGSNVPEDQVLLAVIAVALGGALWAVFRYLRIGLSTRAAAENEKAAILLGYSPDVQACGNWILASVVAGFGGVLVAPLTSLTPTGFSLLIIPALAAALAAQFSSIPIAVGAGLLIGIAQSELQNLPAKLTWFPSVGTQDAFPFVLIALILAVKGQRIPERGAVVLGRLPAVPPAPGSSILPLGGTGVVVSVVLLVVDAGLRLAIVNSITGAMLCLSLVILTGYLGQISLFQMALAGVSAYAVVGVSAGLGVPFPLAPLLGALAGTVVGVAAAVPALRVRGVSLAVASLAAGWAIESFFFDNPSYTGGLTGASVTRPKVLGIDLSFDLKQTVARPVFGIVAAWSLIALAAMVLRVRSGSTGRRMLAVRTNERAAAACGVNVTETKVLGFGLSALIAGVAGAVMAYQQVTVSATAFDVLLSVNILAIAYLGGITRVSGAMVGGLLASGGLVVYVLSTYVFSGSVQATNLEELLSGVGLVLTAVLNPDGIAGAFGSKARRGQRRSKPDPQPTTHPVGLIAQATPVAAQQ
jgi:branched-subunit amino acid ABC-type transport system permease component